MKFLVKPKTALSMLLIFHIAAISYSQTNTTDAKSQTKPEAPSPIVTKDANPRLKYPITLRAKDANLSEVLKVLAERSDMNFVAGEGVHRERITILLHKTPLDEAINLLVRAAGLSYEIIGNSVLIAEPGKLKEEVGQTGYVVELKYATASEVAVMLSDLTKNVKIDEGGNRLVCYTSPRVINEIEKIIRSIDHPHILVVLETRLIEVSMEKLDQYGFSWGNFSPITTQISYAGSPLKEVYDADYWVQMPINFNLAVDLLLSNGDARILMDSKLTTTNNREASLHIGRIIPYKVQSYNLTSAGGMNQQIMKEEDGVKVTMTPHINDDNQITLTLEPEVSNIVEWRGEAFDMPVVKTRKASTTVRVEDGQTIFLAGLLAEEKSVETRKLPVLGDIPLIGMLFQHKREELIKSNLIIEITPRIIFNTAELSFDSDLKTIDKRATKMLKKNLGVESKEKTKKRKKQ